MCCEHRDAILIVDAMRLVDIYSQGRENLCFRNIRHHIFGPGHARDELSWIAIMIMTFDFGLIMNRHHDCDILQTSQTVTVLGHHGIAFMILPTLWHYTRSRSPCQSTLSACLLKWCQLFRTFKKSILWFRCLLFLTNDKVNCFGAHLCVLVWLLYFYIFVIKH